MNTGNKVNMILSVSHVSPSPFQKSARMAANAR
jgi:hypothetical protein